MSKKSKNQWLTVGDLIDILEKYPKDAKCIVENDESFYNGSYYVTRDSITSYTVEGETQVLIGTNHNTIALGGSYENS